jgi:hypothetical protein
MGIIYLALQTDEGMQKIRGRCQGEDRLTLNLESREAQTLQLSSQCIHCIPSSPARGSGLRRHAVAGGSPLHVGCVPLPSCIISKFQTFHNYLAQDLGHSFVPAEVCYSDSSSIHLQAHSGRHKQPNKEESTAKECHSFCHNFFKVFN